MKTKLLLIKILFTACIGILSTNAQVTISTDFTNESLGKADLHNIWSVTNRNTSNDAANIRADMALNRVRILGGIAKTVDGVKVPNLEFDPCTYDTSTNTYKYNWTVLKDRINTYVNANNAIHQLVIDQPPWCFQRGYTFIPAGTNDGIHFREDEKVSKYGNSLPPYDKVAYAEFIKAMMTELIATYGKEKVLSWRIRVGSEIETPEHWYGSKQDFIEHFANTVTAVRAVLPEAKVGVHTRPYNFVYQSGKVLNYKGEPFASFSKDLIEYCYDNNIQYDYWGISDYIVTKNPKHVDIENKYNNLFADYVEHPKWNKNATLDIMEYYVVTTMTGLVRVVTTHAEIMDLAFSNQFYKNYDKGLRSIYRWFIYDDTDDTPGIEVLNTMLGKTRYETLRKGIPKTANNSVDAIFAKEKGTENYDVLMYNYNKKSFSYVSDEDVSLNLTTNAPVGTTYYYRTVSYDKTNNKHTVFFEDRSISDYVIDGVDWKGSWFRVIKKEHLVEYRDFPDPEPHKYTNWYQIKTVARTDGKPGSAISLNTKLPSFAFEKFEFRTELNGELVNFYTLNITSNNGTVTKSVELDEYEEGTSVSLTAVPDSGFRFSAWAGSLSGNAEATTIVMNENKAVTANFEPIPSYSLNITINDGTVNKTPDLDKYEEGASVNLTAAPDTGYVFDSWTGDYEGTENPLSITISEDMEITANFDKLTSNLEHIFGNKVVVMPNPNNGAFRIQLDGTSSAIYELYDMNGTLIQSSLVDSQQWIAIENKKSGIYLLKINTLQESKVLKIIVE